MAPKNSQVYAQALNRLPVGTPITYDTTVTLPGHPDPVPIGQLVHALRIVSAHQGLAAAPDPALVAALAAHGLHHNPTTLPDGRWRLLPSGGTFTWTDQDYAQALNRHPVGTPITNDTTVTLPGYPFSLPIGQMVSKLQDPSAYGGLAAAPDPALVTALAAHGLHHNPTALPDGKWRLQPSQARITWTDQDYAQALNSLPVGTRIMHNTTVTLPGHSVPVPIGQLVNTLRNSSATGGRMAAPDPVLVAALAAHGLHQRPTTLPDGKWRLQPAPAVPARPVPAGNTTTTLTGPTALTGTAPGRVLSIAELLNPPGQPPHLAENPPSPRPAPTTVTKTDRIAPWHLPTPTMPPAATPTTTSAGTPTVPSAGIAAAARLSTATASAQPRAANREDRGHFPTPTRPRSASPSRTSPPHTTTPGTSAPPHR
ncbi:hypothetical protein ACIBEF_32110 [Micromonospora sp. NPDC050795]|uniref:hypothetical protein n=1 Tax=Micromonospora sp. NPDC050795 TaxID=3364282 RepID=UPI0037AB96E3